MKALALLSGGLDSILAIKVMLEQGIEVEALHFTTVFCRCDGKNGACGGNARNTADNFHIKIKTINNTAAMMASVKRPRFGYGRNMNPCIDCRINMLIAAHQYMEATGASFLITGEVLGQRPMSQHLRALKLIEKQTGLEGLILRPLSAKLLEPTIPEKNGWVNREKLLAISGRSRKPQISMAELFEIKDYPCPAGGCLLTDPAFAAILKDLLVHNPDFALNDVLLLNVGRHFRLNQNLKLVVGRNEKENQTISNLAKPEDLLLEVADFVGPVSMLRGQFDDNDLGLSSAITARYADIGPAATVKAKISQDGQYKFLDNIMPLKDEEINKYRINKQNEGR